jgi:RNA-binding protein
MTQKHIPARRSRAKTLRSSDVTPTGATRHRRKRVRAGSDTSKAKRKKASSREAQAAKARAAAEKEASMVPPELTERQRRHLRGLAHPLKPIIRLGNAGLTDAVATETTRALNDHELIKVKGAGGDRDARDAIFIELAKRTASALIHRIGNVAVLYRPNAELSRIMIPDAGS